MRLPVAAALAWIACATAGASADGPPQVSQPGARLPEGSDAAEYWDLAAQFESGHRLFVRFLITQAGPGDRSALAFGHVLPPGGAPVEFRNGRRAGSWQLSPDQRRLTIGSSVLFLGESARHFEIDNDKRGIKLYLDFPVDAPPRAAPVAAGGYHLTLLNLASPATGSLWLDGMPGPQPLAGSVLLRHAWFATAENELIRRRLDVAMLDPEAPLFASEIQPRRGEPWRWLVAGEQSWDGGNGDLRLEVREHRGAEYPIPTRIEVRGKGLEGRISLGRTLLEVDPLDALPTLLRMVYSFGGRPRHLWLEADAEVALKSPAGDAVLRWQGDGIAKLVHLDSDSTPRNER